MGMLDQKTAIVTGGARGIGLAIAKRFVAEGARVVIADIDEAAGKAAAASPGAAVRFVRTDVGAAGDARNVVAEACGVSGDLDILVNNAGIIHTADFLDIAEADFGGRQAVKRRRLEPERQHLGVGRRLVLPPEGFDAGLQDFGRRAFAMPKNHAQITIARDLAGRRRLQIGARNRDGEIGPQAQFAPVRIAGEKHAAADVLARQVEERLRRL